MFNLMLGYLLMLHSPSAHAKPANCANYFDATDRWPRIGPVEEEWAAPDFVVVATIDGTGWIACDGWVPVVLSVAIPDNEIGALGLETMSAASRHRRTLYELAKRVSTELNLPVPPDYASTDPDDRAASTQYGQALMQHAVFSETVLALRQREGEAPTLLLSIHGHSYVALSQVHALHWTQAPLGQSTTHRPYEAPKSPGAYFVAMLPARVVHSANPVVFEANWMHPDGRSSIAGRYTWHPHP